MNDESRKMLAEEVLGECWHISYYDPSGFKRCQKCNSTIKFDEDVHRLFDNIDDFYALKEKIVEMGMWEEFTEFAENSYMGGKEHDEDDVACICSCCCDYVNWLINPERCETVLQWWKSRKEKG